MSVDSLEIYRSDSEIPTTYGGVMLELGRLDPTACIEEEEAFVELLEPTKEYNIRHFQLDPDLAKQLDLGVTVRCHVMHDGVKQVLLISSRNLFERRSYGYFIQPKETDLSNVQGDVSNKGYEVWEAPVKHYNFGNRKWGMEKLDFDLASPASREVSNGLIRSLKQNPTPKEP